MSSVLTPVSSPINIISLFTGVLLREWQSIFDMAYRLYAFFTGERNRGMYEILDYETTLELVDPHGHLAHFYKRQKVRFLQDNIISFQDHAWGEGDLFSEYRCSPGVVADRYQQGDRWNILISLRETKSRGDVEEFNIQSVFRDGYTQPEEWHQVEIRHRTRHLRMKVIFPAERHCRRATLH
ncbi:MAG: hypothetical protein KDE50_00760 [Caldilineaceae bacterium]|nr:hypothetical protein [Caldilineaceae bacterium]MCB0138416.1 hypothetical protein [Caldilineaceae bacterium]